MESDDDYDVKPRPSKSRLDKMLRTELNNTKLNI